MKLHPVARAGNQLRRLIYNLSVTSVVHAGWRHRGSVVRAADLARRLPSRIRQGQTAEALTEARAVLALDRELRSDTSVRLSTISGGTALIKGQPRGRSLDRARSALLSLPDVTDVRTIDPNQLTINDLSVSYVTDQVRDR